MQLSTVGELSRESKVVLVEKYAAHTDRCRKIDIF